jgi:anti-anti-sigma factor
MDRISFVLAGRSFSPRCPNSNLECGSNRSHNLILDLTGVPYVDSAGIGALVGTYVRHQRDENGVSLVGVNDRVHEALKIAHIEQFFRFFDSLGEAQAKHVVS